MVDPFKFLKKGQRACYCDHETHCFGGVRNILCRVKERLPFTPEPPQPTYDALKSSDDDD